MSRAGENRGQTPFSRRPTNELIINTRSTGILRGFCLPKNITAMEVVFIFYLIFERKRGNIYIQYTYYSHIQKIKFIIYRHLTIRFSIV